MRVRDLVSQRTANLITVEPRADLSTAVKLLFSHNIGGLPVVAADGTVVGFIAERDLVRALSENPGPGHRVRVQDVMRHAAVCEADDSLEDVMRRMTRERLRHLVVRDNGRIAGVVSVGDMVKYRVNQLETEAAVLRDYVAGQRASR